MFPHFPTVTLRVAELFSDPYHFTIPAYQRCYSWTIKEAGQLADDLMAAAGVDGADGGEPDYFLSSIVLLAPEHMNERRFQASPGAYDIVDGQQRLITLMLLASVLRGTIETSVPLASRLDKLLGVSEGGPVRINLRGRERDCFERLMTDDLAVSDARVPVQLSVGEANLVAVREHLSGVVGDLDLGERERLAAYICDHCHVVVIYTHEVDRAHRMFTVLNERGRPLQRNDILKAEVLRGVSPGREAAAVLQWDHAADLLGSDFEHLFSHLRVLHGKLKPQVVAAVRQIISASGGADVFLDNELTPLAKAFHYVLRSGDRAVRMDAGVRRHLVYLGRLNGSEWVPAALLVLREHGAESIKARILIGEVDRFAHLLRILCLGNGKRARRFVAVQEAVRDRRPDAIREAVQFSRDELRTIAYNLKDLHRRQPQVAKLILLRLNDELAGELAPRDLTQLTVEHVLPQRPSAGSNWRKLFPDAELRKTCTESLGNLMLVPPRQNDRARNQDFERKKQIYLEAHAEFEVLPLTQEVLDRAQWTPEEVIIREARLLALLSQSWQIDAEFFGAQGRPTQRLAGSEQTAPVLA